METEEGRTQRNAKQPNPQNPRERETQGLETIDRHQTVDIEETQGIQERERDREIERDAK